MHANLELTAAPGKPPRLTRMRHGAPFAWRPTAGAVYLVGTAATPVGDDEVTIDIDVEPGADLLLRTSAATVAWGGEATTQSITATVGHGARLRWQPEPMIATGRCAHRQIVEIRLHGTGRICWREEILLGRHDERPGRLDLALGVDIDGFPLLRHTFAVGDDQPGWDGPAIIGAHRAVGLHLEAGAGSPPSTPAAGPGWARLPLQGPGTLIAALGADLPTLRQALTAGGTS